MEESTHPELSPKQSTQTVVSEDAESQFDLGVKFASGKGAAQDFVQAAECYRKAAGQNHALAQFNLGIMYAEGQGVTEDVTESLVWFGRSARLGDAGAQLKLGDSLHFASLTQLPPFAAESRIEAYKWYRLATVQGYAGAEISSGILSMKMTWADVAAGNMRAAAFKIGQPESPWA
jgi:TPR repeat protein